MIPRFIDASRDPRLRGAARQVYDYLVCDLSPNGWHEKKRSVIALDLHLSERTVDNAIAQLIRFRYIEAGERVPGSPQVYQLVYQRAS